MRTANLQTVLLSIPINKLSCLFRWTNSSGNWKWGWGKITTNRFTKWPWRWVYQRKSKSSTKTSFEKNLVLDTPQRYFFNFSCMFLNPKIFFSNLNCNCFSLLGMRNLQEQAFCCQKLFWPFSKILQILGLQPQISKVFLNH